MDWSLWDVLWTTFVIFVWAMFLVILINVLIDLFRSRDHGVRHLRQWCHPSHQLDTAVA